jgi:hypothetical protein
METHQHNLLVSAGITGLALASLALSPAVSAATIENTVDTFGLAEPIAINYGDHTANAEISPGVDVDGYTFQGHNGDQVRIVMTGLTTGFDPLIELRNPLGSVLQTQSCTASLFTCAVNLDQALADNGIYYLNLSDLGTDDAGAYTLDLEQYPPASNFLSLLYDSPFFDQLGHEGDHDFLGFQGASGTGVSISLEGLTVGLDPHLQIWDPAGGLVDDTDCNASLFTCSFHVDLDLTMDGTYKMAIFDTGFSDLGEYSLNVACTYGSCPSTVPVPTAAWLFGSGLLGLVGIARRRDA